MASRSLGTLTLDLIARIGGFEQGMDKAARISEKRLKQIQTQATAVGNAIGTFLVRGVDAAVSSLTNLFSTTAGYQDIAEKIGDTAESVASLKNAADVSETSFETIAAASVKLSSALAKTDDEGKGVGAAIKALGFELEAFKALSPVEQIDAVAKALARFEDGAKKTAIATTLFSKSGAELLPFLNDLADGAERQITLTQEQIDNANAFAESLAGLKGQVGTLSQQFAAELLPALSSLLSLFETNVMDEFGKNTDSVTESAEGLSAALKALALVAVTAFNAVQGFGRAIVGGYLAQAELLRGNFRRALDEAAIASKAIQGDINDVTKAYQALFEATGTAPAPATGNRPSRPQIDFDPTPNNDPKADASKKAREEAAREAKRQAESIRDVIKSLEDEAAAYGLSNEQLLERKLRIMGANEEQIQQALALQRTVDSSEAMKKKQEEANRVIEAAKTPLQEYNDKIRDLNELRDTYVNGKPLIDARTYERSVREAQEQLDEVVKGVEKVGKTTADTTDDMSVYAEQAARNIQDMFADFLFDPFSKGLDGMLSDFADMLQRMAAQAAAQQILGGLMSFGSGGFLDSLLALGGGLGGNGPPIGGPRALGGPVQPGRAYLVGEDGPEWMVPKSAGTVLPNGMSPGGTNINITIPVTAPTGSVGRPTLDQIQSAAFAGAQMAAARNR